MIRDKLQVWTKIEFGPNFAYLAFGELIEVFVHPSSLSGNIDFD